MSMAKNKSKKNETYIKGSIDRDVMPHTTKEHLFTWFGVLAVIILLFITIKILRNMGT